MAEAGEKLRKMREMAKTIGAIQHRLVIEQSHKRRETAGLIKKNFSYHHE